MPSYSFKQLKRYIEEDIISQYNNFDPAHNIEHVNRVIDNSIEIANDYDVDMMMVYTVAAYHDLGLSIDRKTHHLVSAQMLLEDAMLLEWFSDEQLQIMAQAIRDHRASSTSKPKTIYGLIVSEADRDLDCEIVVKRTIEYGKSHYPHLTRDEHFQRVSEHICEKYGEDGYIKLWLNTPLNQRRIKELVELSKNKKQLLELFNTYY